jgi:transcription initiation factor TFIIB
MECELFKELDTINRVEKVLKCCDIEDNYMHTEEQIIICKVCNNSISNILDCPEKNYVTDTKKTPRHGMPINQLLPKSSVGTTITNQYSSNAMNRIEKYQRWNSMPYKERSLYQVFTTIQTKCDDNNLPAIISRTAKSLYTLIACEKISRGNNRKGIIAACVFNACKECTVPRSSNEIAKIFDIDTKIMTKGIKKYTEIMRLNKKNLERITSIKSINIDDFIDRFSHKLNLVDKDIIGINTIVDQCKLFMIDKDNTPPAMAAGCIYLYIKLLNLDISKKNIANISQISEVTINKCYKKIINDENIKLYLENLGFNDKIN